jgi:hypothetical protein
LFNGQSTSVKQEPTVPSIQQLQPNQSIRQFNINDPPVTCSLATSAPYGMNMINSYAHQGQLYRTLPSAASSDQASMHALGGSSQTSIGLIADPNYYMNTPPPTVMPIHQNLSPMIVPSQASAIPVSMSKLNQNVNHLNVNIISQQPFYYQIPPPSLPPASSHVPQYLPTQMSTPILSPHQANLYFQQVGFYASSAPQVINNMNRQQAFYGSLNSTQYFNNNNNRKRKLGEQNGSFNNKRYKPYNSSFTYGQNSAKNDLSSSSLKSLSTISNEANGSREESFSDTASSLGNENNANVIQYNEEEGDLNIIRERELKDLKSKPVVEKMSVFLKYYKQFKECYVQRVKLIECSDLLKIQFNSLIKYLNEYEMLLVELELMINEHEREQCKNNHRKTKKFFNKAKAFIRYECNKRLQANIFEYRRLINSQDRYAGMYDLLEMNSYLISLLPDIGVSIRRFINRCEKAKEQEHIDDEEEHGGASWLASENSNDSTTNLNQNSSKSIGIPTFNEFVSQTEMGEDGVANENNNFDEAQNYNESISSASNGRSLKTYESFSKGIDSLNRYLLKRVEEEESLDELVKERIIKWINKRQAKYILIFSEVDKLLNQHKTGECYSKFHSYLLFNLGKLVTVCDSYHQKLKELLYSTTIRRKKKRKKVKLLPESMADVFDEVMDLKRALESTKITIKRCNNEFKSNSASKEKDAS